ncbi:hypothetical protein M5C72_09075 [Companilactobacillus allii]|uniref:class III lanthionine synthetase LanKC N-terminal domain-containing protein n=1 Tax=Companilactobacillus allii TaxID=1847728 RepID=UPI0009FA26E3|nr:hypothetical protein [Companilactobacillus allii]USQ68029.1 hypothetical protein M5C72_09075 [Companilactobacillus allii]
MSLDGTEYLKFVNNNNLPFYSYEKILNQSGTIFSTKELDKSKWSVTRDNNWKYIIFNNNLLPNQGWKIHISANINDAAEVLQDISSFLIDKKISFKFVPDSYTLKITYSKYGHREESGKFITVYPSTEKQFCSLLDPLLNIMSAYRNGPYILNDQQWKQSNVFFRYGAFKKMTYNIDGNITYIIKDPRGKCIEDVRAPYYSLPNFIKEPKFILENNVFPNEKVFSDLKSFKIDEAIHFSNAGGVYSAKYNSKRVILKEGRPNVGLDRNNNDGFARIKHEYNTLVKLRYVDEIVNPINYKEIWNHNYLVEDIVDGESLSEFIAREYPFSNDISAKDYLKKATRISITLMSIVKKVHNYGIAIGDLQPSNIMVINNHDCISLKLIDLECATRINNKFEPGLVTQDFVSQHSKTFGAADWYAVYKISRHLFLPIESGMNFSKNFIMRQNENIEDKFGKSAIKTLTYVSNEISKYINIYPSPNFYNKELDVPKYKYSMKNVENNIVGLDLGLIKNLNF